MRAVNYNDATTNVDLVIRPIFHANEKENRSTAHV